MQSMFTYAISFNQSLDAWNISAVKDISRMFKNASSFNQNLCSWGQIPTFPWTSIDLMFSDSGCTKKTSPIQDMKAPFCASNC
jgi:hypothetical protein